MIISRAQVDRVLRVYLEAGTAAGPQFGPRPGPAGDAVSLSDQGQRIARYAAQARQLPDVRPERVAALREAVRSGHYDVSPDAVAAKLIERILADMAAEVVE